MALDSPHLEHHSSWMQVLDGHPVGCEDPSGNLKFKTQNQKFIIAWRLNQTTGVQ